MIGRFWAKVDRIGCLDGQGCWEWMGARTKSGYGRFGVRSGFTAYAHRFAFELANGPIPGGMVVDHLCRNRSCVNPGHLETVSRRENTIRGLGSPGVNARKLTCLRGHELHGDNLYVPPGQNKRLCRRCSAERARRNRAGQRRSRQRATSCGKGHAFTESNTYTRPDGGGRMCRECKRLASAKHRERVRR